MNRCASSLAKQRSQLASAAANRSLPRPPPLAPHHQIIAKYLLMFFFHPSKRWSSACSSAPFWVCCVWRQCSASEPSEVKGGHRERGPESRLGVPPSPPTPANLPPGGEAKRGRSGWAGSDPRPARPVPLPALPRGSPVPALPAGRGEGRGCDPHVRPGGRGCFMCKGPGGRNRRGTAPFPSSCT